MLAIKSDFLEETCSLHDIGMDLRLTWRSKAVMPVDSMMGRCIFTDVKEDTLTGGSEGLMHPSESLGSKNQES